ncbi:hypothetical protein B0T16DRAFT_356337 [Cercophora newfieldiana]|uniref:Uncharacterized protein n=1 Tax=Cercophora newfieldiana TaxID=92897 RepID=A0AA40CP36_9PEZI|nr:hypothetical protein B0T16DRAFT_356337 [Cercophora newfieldiana]
MDLDEDQICAEFDRRVYEGIVVFNKEYRTIPYSDNGFQIEFRLLSGLARKPGVSTPSPPTPTSTSTSGSASNTEQPPGLLPGSDINVHNYEITTLGKTHLLAFNKFSAARPHLLFLTQDGYRRQHEALDIDDFTALWTVMTRFTKSRYLAIFNCGVDSGCSRLHKHMQVFGAPEGFGLWPDEEGGKGKGKGKGVPFRYFLGRFDGGFPGPEGLLGVYQGLLGQAEAVLGWERGERGEEEAAPHNVVLDRRWMLVVPRRAPGLNGADANAAAVLGMLWVSDEEKMRRWTDQGPARVLAHLGVPAEQGEGSEE